MPDAGEMRMAELARRAELSVPTIKYYLREGLVQPGRRTSANQAVYDQQHLERLRLIRALATVAGLPLSKIRMVVDVVDRRSSVLDAMAVVQDTLVGEPGDGELPEAAAALLDRVVTERGWSSAKSSPAYAMAVRAIDELEKEQLGFILARVDDYAKAADAVARTDLDSVAEAESVDSMIRGVVLGNALRRPMLDALVLLAQQHYAKSVTPASHRR
ncbi:MAG: MerR family transcriptional regulator [Brevibacterium sp.]